MRPPSFHFAASSLGIPCRLHLCKKVHLSFSPSLLPGLSPSLSRVSRADFPVESMRGASTPRPFLSQKAESGSRAESKQCSPKTWNKNKASHNREWNKERDTCRERETYAPLERCLFLIKSLPRFRQPPHKTFRQDKKVFVIARKVNEQSFSLCLFSPRITYDIKSDFVTRPRKKSASNELDHSSVKF